MLRQISHFFTFAKAGFFVFFCAVILIANTQVFAMERQPEESFPFFGFTGQQFEVEVKKYLKIPYRKGGTTRKGMDCSGFAKTVYSRLFGIELPHNSTQQFCFSALRKIDELNLQPGDLIFFAGKKKKKINHVGVYISDRQFIHASSTLGITVSSLDDSFWKKRFVGSKRHKDLNFPAEDKWSQ
jgi:hypothetical protein